MTIKAPFVVTKAAAGSGKTFALVLEYLKLALAGPREGIGYRFRGILAITFTNKAANEMKQRIMQELDRMATEGVDPDSHTMGARLLEELNSSAPTPMTPAELQQRAAELQNAILHHYTDLSVMTIDSFMHRIVRTFAHDLGQPVSFEVMIDKQMMIDEAVEQLMSLVGTEGNEELTRLLQAYADSKMEDDHTYDVKGSVASLAKQLFEEDAWRRLEGLAALTPGDFHEIHRRYIDANRKVEQNLKTAGKEVMDLLAGVRATVDNCYQKNSGYFGYFSRLADGEIEPPGKNTVKSLTGGSLTSSKCDRALAASIEALRPQMEAIYGKVQADIVGYYSRCAILDRLYVTALLGRMSELLKDYSHDNEVLHLSEFNRMINSIVEDEDNPAPFIFERLGNRYRHFLIDEFQDTSTMQWHNLVPLVENGVAQGRESLVVGDAKQAIYRFRQGDVAQFVRLPRVEGMVNHGRTLGLPGNSRQCLLDTNYRTARAVVGFNNDFFSWLVRNRYADNALAQEIYVGRGADGELNGMGDEVLRQRTDSSLEGHVGVKFIEKEEKDWVYEEVASTIKMLVGERGYSYGDIMVLARKNFQLAELGVYLTENTNIPQTSTLSFQLRKSDAAMAVVAALRCLVDRRNRVAVADLLQRLTSLGIIGEGQWLVGGGKVDLQQVLRTEGIEFRPEYLATLDLYDCCEELVRQLHLDGIDLPYVASLLDAAATFASRHRQQIGDFLKWIDENEDLSASTSDQLDAVRLLTIHKAKGLEAPVVICMFLKQENRPHSIWVDVPPEEEVDGPQLPAAYVKLNKEEPTWFDSQRVNEEGLKAIDNLNLLYVALTRPREQLYILCHKSKSGFQAVLHDYLADKIDEEKWIDIGDAGWCKEQSGRQKNAAQNSVVTLQRLSFADWTSKVSIASPAEKAITPLLEDKVRFGIYAHELMSDIIYAADVDAALERFRQSHDITDEEADVLAKMAQTAVNHSDASRFFAEGNRVVNEVSLMADGELERPDRVVFADGETWVVDFKTGTPVPQNVAQVKGYCRAVAAMGHPAVSGWLLYLHPDGVEVVKAE